MYLPTTVIKFQDVKTPFTSRKTLGHRDESTAGWRLIREASARQSLWFI